MARGWLHYFRSMTYLCFFLNMTSNDGCMQTIPKDGFIPGIGFVSPGDCVVPPNPCGTFSQPSNTVLPNGAVLQSACDPSCCASGANSATARCNNGVITPDIACTPTFCPTATPLLMDGIPAPGNTQMTLSASGPVQAGDFVYASCIRFTGIVFGTIINVQYDNGFFGCQNANNNPAQNFAERVTLTCTCSGDYNVDMRQGNPCCLVPESGIVSAPNSIRCRYAVPMPCPGPG